jgi:hypothetical protein
LDGSYPVAQELPIFTVVFLIPAMIAAMVAWGLTKL